MFTIVQLLYLNKLHKQCVQIRNKWGLSCAKLRATSLYNFKLQTLKTVLELSCGFFLNEGSIGIVMMSKAVLVNHTSNMYSLFIFPGLKSNVDFTENVFHLALTEGYLQKATF